MKKLSKLLLVVLTVALLATTVFSTLGLAANSEGETALIGKATELGINRKVEDFTAEDVLIQDNIIPGEAYADSSKKNSLTWIDRDVSSTASNKYGVLATVDSQSGNRYLRLMYEKPYASGTGVTYKSGINISDKQAFADNDYLIYEWDMTTETQYPTNFAAFFLNSNSSTVGDKPALFTMNADGTKIVVGDKEYDLGGAGTWHHFTVVISLIASGTDYRSSLGSVYMDGEKIAEFTPVANKSRKNALSLFLGYYNQARDAEGTNATVCVDNVVSTSVPKGYKDAGDDKLAPLFATTDTVTDLKLIGSDVLVYSAAYELPVEPSIANTKEDGTRKFYKTFDEAYADYKTGGFKWMELYESAEGAIDAPVVIKLAGNVTFTNTATDSPYPCIEATGADGSLYKTFTNSTETFTIRFFSGRKGTTDGEVVALEVPFGVGIIPTVPADYAPITYSENPEDLKKVYEVTDRVEVYMGGELQTEMPLVREAMIAGAVVVDVYPVYELKNVAFDIALTEAGTTTRQFFTQSNQFSAALKAAPDGATVTLRQNIGADAKIDINGKTLAIDLAGKALYPAGSSAFVLFELKGANLSIYSSEANANLYCGVGSGAQALMNLNGNASTVRIGYTDDAAKDAYAGNLTIHTSTIVKASAEANVTFANVDVKVVAASASTNGIIELSGSKCSNTLITLENVNVYNTYVENNVIAYTNMVGTSNRVVLKNTTVYAPQKTEANGKGMINIVGEMPNATNQSVHLDGFTYFGNLSGNSVGDAGQVLLTVVGTVEAASLDRDTLRTEEGTLFIHNNRSINAVSFSYVAGGAFANSTTSVFGSKTPALKSYIAVGKTVADFCKVTWFFYADAGIVEEYWVRGVSPVYDGIVPVSPEGVSYNFEGVALDVIADDAAELTIEANEYISLELLALQQNISIVNGMAYNLYIPANIPVSAIIVGGTTLTTENMTLSEDGAYYIISLGNFTLRNIASTSYAFTVKVTTVRNNTLTVASEANVLAYFEAAYEDTTLMEVEKRMITAFLKYAQSAGEYLGVDTAAITELLAGKTANYYTIESGDFVNDTGVLRSAVKGVRMSLVDVPTFVFYLRETFSGTVTIGTKEYTVENGKADGKGYILYTPASYAVLGDIFTVTVNGTLAGNAVDGTGAFSLTNYLMGVRAEEGVTPSYILDLYQFFRVAKAVETIKAENEMSY